jgi:hypothetical protein
MKVEVAGLPVSDVDRLRLLQAAGTLHAPA